jgi:hypothetical protein
MGRRPSRSLPKSIRSTKHPNPPVIVRAQPELIDPRMHYALESAPPSSGTFMYSSAHSCM